MEGFERQGVREIVDLGGAGVSPFHRFLARGETASCAWTSSGLAHRDELAAALV